MLLFPGCVGFHYQWHHTNLKSQQANTQSIEGLWTGSWQSAHGNHSGKLRCVIRKQSPNTYTFFYRATWARVITGNFKINCEAQNEDGNWNFSGGEALGVLGGKGFHPGRATSKAIQARYRSEKGDTGTFTLSRP